MPAQQHVDCHSGYHVLLGASLLTGPWKDSGNSRAGDSRAKPGYPVQVNQSKLNGLLRHTPRFHLISLRKRRRQALSLATGWQQDISWRGRGGELPLHIQPHTTLPRIPPIMSGPLPAYCTALLSWKVDSGLTFAQIAEKLGKPEVWTTALFFGQTKTDDATAKKLLEIVAIGADDTLEYYTIDDPAIKHCPGRMVVQGLSGKGVDSRGVDGMVTRGGTWEWPPKVGPGAWRSAHPRTQLSTACTRF